MLPHQTTPEGSIEVVAAAVIRFKTENARSTSSSLKMMLNSVSIDITSTKLIPSHAMAFRSG